MGSNLCRELPQQIVGCLINDFTVCMSLAYTLELLTIYGIKAFYMQSLGNLNFILNVVYYSYQFMFKVILCFALFKYRNLRDS